MAIVNSLGIGRSRKSAGNLTYRTIRGRCIASQRREKIGNPSGDISVAQATFSIISTFIRSHASDIDVSFNKSTYGSARNNFYKKNKSALAAAVATLAAAYSSTKNKPSAADIDTAVGNYATTNPNSILRVDLAGFDVVYMSGPWSSDDNPVAGGGINELGRGTATVSAAGSDYEAPVSCSLNFYAGAKITRPEGTATVTCEGLPADVQPAQISYITSTGLPVTALIVSSVASSVAGKIVFEAPAIESSDNVVAVQIGGVYVRLTSAYVKKAGEEGGGGL